MTGRVSQKKINKINYKILNEINSLFLINTMINLK